MTNPFPGVVRQNGNAVLPVLGATSLAEDRSFELSADEAGNRPIKLVISGLLRQSKGVHQHLPILEVPVVAEHFLGFQKQLRVLFP